MPTVSLILVSGWGYPAAVLAGLGRELQSVGSVVLASAHALARAGSALAAESDRAGCSPLAAGLGMLIASREDRPVVAGWSLGGVAALELAVRRPGLLGGLVLLAAAPRFCAGTGYPHGTPAAQVRAMLRGVRRDPAGTLAEFYRLSAAPLPAMPLPAGAAEDAPAPAELAAGLEYLRDIDLRPELGAARLPLLVIHGESDRVLDWRAAHTLPAALSQASWRLLAGAGHDFPVRHPAATAAAIRDWLARVSASGGDRASCLRSPHPCH